MLQSFFTLIENNQLTPSVHELKLQGDCSAITAPGQFVQVSVPGKFLRRPFSVCDVTDDVLTLCVRVSGEGTDVLCSLPVGTELDLLTGLGNGFDLAETSPLPLLIGGGSGVGALYGLAKALLQRGRIVHAALCFRTAEDAYYVNQFKALGAEVTVFTEDGSLGEEGNALFALMLPHWDVFACGPLGMMQALDDACENPLQLSLEARMGCGFGACMGCTIETEDGPKRVCKDGPVFKGQTIVWPEEDED